MASPFSSFSSSEIHDSAIDAIIAEATDLCALEQIAALNTAHLSDSSSLPTNLETRFRNLKTLPPATVATPLPTTATPPPPPQHRVSNNNQEEEEEEEEKENIPTPTTHDPKPELPTPNQPINIEPEIEKANKASAPPSPPPQRQASCCFCFSPKKIQRRKSNANTGVGTPDDELLDNIFSELGSSSSMKESRRRLQKVWKEQEKASREAEKMVKWVKQVSARIKEASIEELLDEEFK